MGAASLILTLALGLLLLDAARAKKANGKWCHKVRLVDIIAPRDLSPRVSIISPQVEAVGICAGDAKTFTGAERFWGEALEDSSTTYSLPSQMQCSAVHWPSRERR
jgi:hypothetical protein